MSIYTVHEPPLRAADDLAEPDRFAFVRDGFHVWAFLLTPLWMLWHRLWLVLLCYVLFSAALDIVLAVVGASAAVVALVDVLVMLLIGLEAGTLRRLTLRRRGWRDIGIVSGEDREDAERRFFDSWARSSPPQPGTPAAPTPPAVAPRPAQSVSLGATGVIGLFPEPGAQR
jgi:hypothetical protein